MINEYIIGEEIKFAIDLTAIGFDMVNDNFEIEVSGRGKSVKSYKDSQSSDGSLRIFHEGDSSSSDSGSSGSDSSDSMEDVAYYGIINTDGFSSGELKVTATAYVNDVYASEGTRKQKAQDILCKLKNK